MRSIFSLLNVDSEGALRNLKELRSLPSTCFIVQVLIKNLSTCFIVQS